MREQLDAWGLDDLVLTTELLVSELVCNIVRPARHTDEGGRGLQRVAALSRRWGARHLDDGKCIWTEQDLPLAHVGSPVAARRERG